MTEQNANQSAIEQNVNQPEAMVTVHYWIDGYWTVDEKEVATADRFGLYEGQSRCVQLPESTTKEEVTDRITTLCEAWIEEPADHPV